MVVGRPDDAGMTLLRSKVGRGAGGDSVLDVGVKDGEQVRRRRRKKSSLPPTSCCGFSWVLGCASAFWLPVIVASVECCCSAMLMGMMVSR